MAPALSSLEPTTSLPAPSSEKKHSSSQFSLMKKRAASTKETADVSFNEDENDMRETGIVILH